VSTSLLYALARPILFACDAESAHHFTLPALKHAHQLGLTSLITKPALDKRQVMGITFPNPVWIKMVPLLMVWQH
jgi:dihydroorotate dehydrogenase